jgi:hypothetical protein
VPADRSDEPVRTFATFTGDLHKLAWAGDITYIPSASGGLS